MRGMQKFGGPEAYCAKKTLHRNKFSSTTAVQVVSKRAGFDLVIIVQCSSQCCGREGGRGTNKVLYLLRSPRPCPVGFLTKDIRSTTHARAFVQVLHLSCRYGGILCPSPLLRRYCSLGGQDKARPRQGLCYCPTTIRAQIR